MSDKFPYTGYRPSEDIARDLLRKPVPMDQQKRVENLLADLHENNAENDRLLAEKARLTATLRQVRSCLHHCQHEAALHYLNDALDGGEAA